MPLACLLVDMKVAAKSRFSDGPRAAADGELKNWVIGSYERGFIDKRISSESLEGLKD